MPVSCVVGGCTRNNAKNPDVFWLTFPKDAVTQQAWIRFVNKTRSDFKFTSWFRPIICSAHFIDDCVDETVSMKRSLGLPFRFKLKFGSVPSIKAPTVVKRPSSKKIITTTAQLQLQDGVGCSTSQAVGISEETEKDPGGAYLKRKRARTEPEQAKLKKHAKSETHVKSHTCKAAKLKNSKIKMSAELGKSAKSKTSNTKKKSAKKIQPFIIKFKPDGLLPTMTITKRKPPIMSVTHAELENVTNLKKSTELKKPTKVDKTVRLKTSTCTKLRTSVESDEAAMLKIKDSVELETHAKSKQICAAFGCSHPRVKFGCTFYSFPKNKKLAKKWLRAAKCDVAENNSTGTQLITDRNLRLCNCHFEKRPNPKNKVVPTIFFNAASSLKTEPVSERSPQQERKLKRKKSLDQIEDEQPKKSGYQEADEQPKKSGYQENGFWKHYHQLKEDSSRYKETCNSLQLLSLQNVKNIDSVFEMYTGLPKYVIFKLLHDYLNPNAMKIKPDPSQFNEDVEDAEMNSEQSLTSEEELFLFLVGSRTGNSVSDLAVRFGVSEKRYRFIFASCAVFVSSKLEDLYRTVGATDGEATGKHSEMCVAVDFTAVFSNSPSVLQINNQNPSRCEHRKLIVLSLNDKGAVTGVITMLDGPAFVKVAPNKYLDFTRVHRQFTDPPRGNANMPKMSLVDIDRTLDRIKRFSYLRQQVDSMQLDIFERVFKACAYLTNFQSAFRHSK